MADKCNPNGNNSSIRDKVCIHTDKVYDACKEKDCLEDLRVFLTVCGQEIVDRAINVKFRKAEIIWVYTDVEPVPFNKGFYTVDLKYFFKVYLDVFTGCGRPVLVEGLATFDKKIILFGSEGNANIFSSKYRPDDSDIAECVKTNLPKAIVEVVDPIALNAKIVDKSDSCCCECDMDVSSIPGEICKCFDDDIVVAGHNRKVYVTLGLFTIVRLERSVELLIPVYDFCVPEKECVGSTEEDPCNIFRRLKFPVDEFFPPCKPSNITEQANNNACENNNNKCCR